MCGCYWGLYLHHLDVYLCYPPEAEVLAQYADTAITVMCKKQKAVSAYL